MDKLALKTADFVTADRGLNELGDRIYDINVEKGFWPANPTDRNMGEALMLITTELGEALEAHRAGKFCRADLSQILTNHDYNEKVKGSMEEEFADALIRLLDTARGFNIDIQKHVELKIAYNKTRPHKHGKNY